MTEIQKNPLAKNSDAISLIRFAFPSMVMMLATGGSAVIAKKMGNGTIEEARSNFTLIVVAGAVIGLLITATELLFLDEIIWGLGASEVLFPYCREYLTVQLIFVVGNMMLVLYQNLFVTAGKPTLGLVLAVLAGIANIVFDYVFIVLQQMVIKGAAIGYMIPTIIGTIFFLTGSRISVTDSECGDRIAAGRKVGVLPSGRSELYFCKPKMDASVLLKSCSNGVSEMVSQCSTAVTTFLFNVTMMKLLGEDGVAAINIFPVPFNNALYWLFYGNSPSCKL